MSIGGCLLLVYWLGMVVVNRNNLARGSVDSVPHNRYGVHVRQHGFGRSP